MQTRKSTKLLGFVVGTLLPFVVFTGGSVVFKSSTFTLAALLIIPFLHFLDYYIVGQCLTKDRPASNYLLFAPPTPPIYVIVHHAGLGMFLLVFNQLTVLQQVLVAISFVLAHNIVALEGIRVFLRFQKAYGAEDSAVGNTVLWWLFFFTLAALYPLGMALYNRMEYLAIVLLLTMWLTFPQLPALPRLD